MKWRAEIDIDASPARLWRLLTDVEALPGQVPAVKSAVLLDPLPLRAGSRVRLKVEFAGTEREVIATAAEVVHERTLAWKAEVPGAPAALSAQWHILPTSSGCRLRQNLELAFSSPLARMAAGAMLGNLVTDARMRTALERLKMVAESPEGP